MQISRTYPDTVGSAGNKAGYIRLFLITRKDCCFKPVLVFFYCSLSHLVHFA